MTDLKMSDQKWSQSVGAARPKQVELSATQKTSFGDRKQ